jgi:hypothetical protein
MHDSEYSLLHFTSVGGAEDHKLLG